MYFALYMISPFHAYSWCHTWHKQNEPIHCPFFNGLQSLAKLRIYSLPFSPGKFLDLINDSSFNIQCSLLIVVTRIDLPEKSTRIASSQFQMFTKRGNEWIRVLWNLLIAYRLSLGCIFAFIYFSGRIYDFLVTHKQSFPDSKYQSALYKKLRPLWQPEHSEKNSASFLIRTRIVVELRCTVLPRYFFF